MRDVFHYNECIGPRPARVRSIAGPYRSRETGARWTHGSRGTPRGTRGTGRASRRARPREAPQPMARARCGDLDPVERSAGCSCRDPETRLSFSAHATTSKTRHTACFVSAYFRERRGVRVLFIKVCENEGCRRASFCGKNNSPLQEPPVQPLYKKATATHGTSNNKFITTRAPGQARVGLGTSHSSRGGTAREHARDRESTNNFTRVTPHAHALETRLSET